MAQKAAMEKINPAVSAGKIVNGSFIKTNRGYFFVSTALGKVVIDGITVMAVSPQSPLGIKLMGLNEGAVAEVNSNKYIIESIA
jgi:transcription elongation GreA/GreB family factor